MHFKVFVTNNSPQLSTWISSFWFSCLNSIQFSCVHLNSFRACYLERDFEGAYIDAMFRRVGFGCWYELAAGTVVENVQLLAVLLC